MSAAKMIDDLARFAGGTMSVASSVRHSVREEIKSRLDELVDRMDLVTRDEYERLESSLQSALKRIDELEAQLNKKAAPKKSSSRKKT